MLGGGIIKSLAATAHEYWGQFRNPRKVFLPPLMGWLQLFCKTEAPLPERSSQVVSLLATLLLFMSLSCMLALIPWGPQSVFVHTEAGLLLFMGAQTTICFAGCMACWALQTPNSLLESGRRLLQMMSFTLPLLVSVLPLALLGGRLDLPGIVQNQSGYGGYVVPHWGLFSPCGFFAFLLFVCSGSVACGLGPFRLDAASTGMGSDFSAGYSGARKALFILSSHLNLLLFCALAATLFLGGYQSPCAFLCWVPSFIWVALKTLALFLFLHWVRDSLPRLRPAQTLTFCWKVLFPLACCNLLLTGLWHYAGEWGGLGCMLLRWIVCPLVGIGIFYGWISFLEKKARFAPRSYTYAKK